MQRRGRFCWGLMLALLGCLAGGARADVVTAREALAHGRWQVAEAGFRQALVLSPGPANLGLAEVHWLAGRTDEALREAEQAALSLPSAEAADTLRAQIYLSVGKLNEAVALLQAATKTNARNYHARLLLGEAYRESGRGKEAAGIFERLLQALSDLEGRQKLDAAQLEYRARALTALHRWQAANRAFQAAVEADDRRLDGSVAWARLFLRKYNTPDAAETLRQALKLNPHHPAALTLMGSIQFESGRNVARATALADEALKNNPRFPEAFILKARLALDDVRTAEAERLLAKALAINPRHLEARALLAASHYLREDMAGYQTERDRVLKLNPEDAAFFVTVGKLAERHHRYREAVEFGRQALRIDPADTDALALAGTNLMREGIPGEKEGLALVRRAFDGDPFNVRTFNTLNLYEDYLAKDYVTVPQGDFIFRFPKKERPLLERYVPRTLTEAWQRYLKKYGFRPRTPITVELFSDRSLYGARTIGLPELGAQGTCFGQLITAMSPAAGEADWEEVLSHELAHVFHIQLSRGRVSRWFTEGLAEYETNVARPYWKRERTGEVFAMLRAGDLWSLGELSAAFTRPGRRNGVLLAYQESALAIHYLADTYGFPKIVEALKLYGAGKSDAETLKAITGKDIAALDAGFRDYLRKTMPWYAHGYRFSPPPPAEQEALKQAAAEKPKDASAQARYAAVLLAAGDAKAAAARAEAALKLDAKNADARMILALVALSEGTDAGRQTARKQLETLLAQGTDGFGIRMRLAALAEKAGDEAAFLDHSQAAKKWDPDSSQPYDLRRRYFEAHDRRADLLAETEVLLQLREHDHELARLLLDRYALDGDRAGILRVAPRLIALTPAEYFVHAEYGKALAANKRPREAAYELESALLAQPNRRGKLRGFLSRQYLLLGEKAKARAAAEQALKELPGERNALQTLKELGPR